MSRGRGGPPLFFSLPRTAIYFYQRFPWDVNSHLPSTSRIFLSHAFSPLLSISLPPTSTIWKTLCGLPRSSGKWRQNSERRGLKVFFHHGTTTVGRAWRHACHTLRLLWLYYFSPFSFSLQDSHLLFIYLLHLQSSYVFYYGVRSLTI